MQLIFEQLRTGGDRNFGYLIADREAAQGVLVDPSYDPELLVERAAAQGITVTAILNTHGHPDHTNGNSRAVEITSAPVAAHPDAPTPPTRALADREELTVGSVTLRCLYTPGHSVDHIVLYEPTHRFLVTGDLLFVGKVGGAQTDEDARIEWASLQRVLSEVPDDTTVWPGHDYGVRPSSTIGLERRTNPFLAVEDVEKFLERRREWPEFKKRHGLK